MCFHVGGVALQAQENRRTVAYRSKKRKLRTSALLRDSSLAVVQMYFIEVNTRVLKNEVIYKWLTGSC